MQLVDLLAVGEQLDDDDGGGERQPEREIERLQRPETERGRERVARSAGERHLHGACREHRRPDRAQEADVELQPDDEEEERDPDRGEQLELVRGLDEPDAARPRHDPGRDEEADERLPQPERADAGHDGGEQDERDLVEEADLEQGHATPTLAPS